jgi:tetratricopeptide (TPR) repeat protein
VRYLLDGSVRKSHDRIRITGQLIDATSTQHLWSKRFEGDLSDIFTLQDEIATQVAGAVGPRLEQAEIQRARSKPTENLSAYDCYLRGLASFYREDRQGNEEALQFFLRAVEIDPDFASAYGMAARCYVQRKNDGWVKDAALEIAETARLSWRAAELGSDDAVALCAAALGLGSVVRDVDAAVTLIDRSIELNPNLALAWSNSAWIRAWLGDSKHAIEHAAWAMRLSPVDPRRYTMDAAMASGYFVAGQYDDAIVWGEKAARAKPSYLPGVRVLAASYALGGRQAEARAVMSDIRRLEPDRRCSHFEDYLPHRRSSDRERYIAGLRLAGLPE